MLVILLLLLYSPNCWMVLRRLLHMVVRHFLSQRETTVLHADYRLFSSLFSSLFAGKTLPCPYRPYITAVASRVQGTRGTSCSLVGADDFQTHHWPGKLHTNADALSRTLPPQQTNIAAALSVDPSSISNWVPAWTNKDLQHQQANDPDLKIVLDWLKTPSERPTFAQIGSKGPIIRSLWAQWNRLEVRDNVLYRRWEDNVGAK